MATKKAVKSVAKKASSDTKELTPLEKARIARASGKGKKKKAGKKAGHTFKAPEEVKSFFLNLQVKIDKDGIVGDMKATRIKGSPTNENAKKVDLGLHDPDTLRRLTARYCGKAFIGNESKRLPGNSLASLLMRVSISSADKTIKCSFKDIKFKEGKEGKLKKLDKKDAKYRNLRKPARFLASAFTKVKDFPSNAELKELEAE